MLTWGVVLPGIALALSSSKSASISWTKVPPMASARAVWLPVLTKAVLLPGGFLLIGIGSHPPLPTATYRATHSLADARY